MSKAFTLGQWVRGVRGVQAAVTEPIEGSLRTHSRTAPPPKTRPDHTLDIDVQGAFQVKRAMPEAFMLFILPPGDEELLRRLRARAREPEAMIQSRFAEAKREIELAEASGVYDATVVNDDLDGAIEEACRLVSERLGLV